MAEIAGLPFVRLKFDKDGDRVEPGTPVRPAGIGNLIVIAHGWKNDEAAADRLYATLVGNMRAAPGGAALIDGKFGVTGVYWPAFVFKPDLTILPADVDGQAGGTAGTGEADVSAQELRDFADAVADFLGVEDADSFRQQVLEARGGGGAADDLADRLRAEVSTEGADAEVIFEQEGRDLRGRELFEALKAPPALGAAGGDTGAAMGGIGAAFRLPRFLSGPRAAVARMLNQFTYFEMKKRAGVVGVKLAATLQADGLDGVGLHLVGHSFGARLVTATASRLTTIRPKSLSLLQGAYSHNGLGVGKGTVPQGAFRNVVADRRVTGPIVITHTRNDTAVGIAYAVASRASGVNAAAFGGPDDAFGGMGANGAQLLGAGEAVAGRITSAGAPALRAGLINNLLADDVVKDHNDVANPGVARVVLAAVQA
jgi:hypothetical protein